MVVRTVMFHLRILAVAFIGVVVALSCFGRNGSLEDLLADFGHFCEFATNSLGLPDFLFHLRRLIPFSVGSASRIEICHGGG